MDTHDALVSIALLALALSHATLALGALRQSERLHRLERKH